MPGPKPALSPALMALLAQLTALALFYPAQLELPLWQGIVAALIGVLLRLPWWWFPINLLFPLAVVTIHAMGLPPWLFLLIFSLLLLFNWSAVTERVPLYLSNRASWEAVAQLLPQQNELHFIDLGSGLGGLLIYLARRYPHYRFYGVESSPLSYLVSRIRVGLSGCRNIELRRGDLWDEDLACYDVVYAFLSPAPMPRLLAKALREMRHSSLLVSNSFAVDDPPPSGTIEVNDRRHSRLLCWEMPGAQP